MFASRRWRRASPRVRAQPILRSAKRSHVLCRRRAWEGRFLLMGQPVQFASSNSLKREPQPLRKRRPFHNRACRSGGRFASLPALGGIPVVDVAAHLILAISVALLNFSLELVTLASNHVEIIVCELAPVLFHLALELLPIALNTIPIHASAPV